MGLFTPIYLVYAFENSWFIRKEPLYIYSKFTCLEHVHQSMIMLVRADGM